MKLSIKLIKNKLQECSRALIEDNNLSSTYISDDKSVRIMMERTYINGNNIIYIVKQVWYDFKWHTISEAICFESKNPVAVALQLLGFSSR